MDNKGRVTVVLHWDQRQGQSGGAGPPNDKFSPSKKGLSAQSSIDKSSPAPQRYPSPQITVINHDDPSNLYHSGILLPSPPPPPSPRSSGTDFARILSFLPGPNIRRLSKGGGSFDSAVGAVHIHTPECAHHAHTPTVSEGASGLK